MEFIKTNNRKYTLSKEQMTTVQQFFDSYRNQMNDWERKFVYTLLKYQTITIPQRHTLRVIFQNVPQREVLPTL